MLQPPWRPNKPNQTKPNQTKPNQTKIPQPHRMVSPATAACIGWVRLGKREPGGGAWGKILQVLGSRRVDLTWSIREVNPFVHTFGVWILRLCNTTPPPKKRNPPAPDLGFGSWGCAIPPPQKNLSAPHTSFPPSCPPAGHCPRRA